MADHRQLLWNTSRLSMQDSPPISPLVYSPNMYPSTIHQTVYQFPGPVNDGNQLKPPPNAAINTSAVSISSQMQTNWYGNYVSHSPVGYGHFQSPSSFKLSAPSHHNVPISPLAVSPKPKLEGSID